MKSLKITEEEKDALMKYVNWEYTYINLLTSGDIEAINKLNNEQLNVFSKKYFKEQMEILKRIYSVMVKNTYGQQNGIRSLERGTTLSEVKSIEMLNGECNKSLSTSGEIDVAKQHAGPKVMGANLKDDDKVPVIMHLSVRDSNLPGLYVNNILEEENLHHREKEYIIAPFTKFKNIRHVSSWNEYEYYSADVEGQELEKVENKEELLDDINENISNIPNLVYVYNQSKGEYERALRFLRTYDCEQEEKKYLQKQIDEKTEEMQETKKAFEEIREKMVQYAKGICYDIRQKVEKEAVEEEKQIKMQELQEKREFKKESLNNYSNVVKGYLRTLIENTSRYKMYAKELGLAWDTEISEQSLIQVADEIQKRYYSTNRIRRQRRFNRRL